MQSEASGSCFSLYNGGMTDQQYCPTPVPSTKLAFTESTPTKTPHQTTGGQTIYPPSKTKSTPKTGPEDLSLVGLLIAGGAGLFLQKKAKSV
ncbi:MAG TPA: LPXTG cell wall anchor domain-containing protein [Candidatus Sulfotelmatobacter sp.]|jgi:LPXTG-motif cell wall-anchored protein|nr:LPXTG cell wall anchor domain-containing protein [Candidatus Sulfotelmatobacter sp.]